YVQRVGVAPVALDFERHPLLAAEDALPQRERRRQLALVLCEADLQLLRVAGDVGREQGLAWVRPLMQEGELALRVVEGGRRERRDSLEDSGDLEVRVLVARIRDRELLQEAARLAAVVVRVHAEERDPAPELQRQALEQRELGAAGATPGGPLVDHDGIALQLPQAGLERVGAAGKEAARLIVDRRERRRGPGQRLARRGAAGRGAPRSA